MLLILFHFTSVTPFPYTKNSVIWPLGMIKFENHNYLQGEVAHTCNPSNLGGQGRWITRSRDRDHPGQHGETPSLLKIQKLAGDGGMCL